METITFELIFHCFSFICTIAFFTYVHSDTPHHLKNKRVQHGAIDKAAATILLANVPKPLETVPTNIINDSNISDRGGEQKSSHLNECGKFCICYYCYTRNQFGIVQKLSFVVVGLRN